MASPSLGQGAELGNAPHRTASGAPWLLHTCTPEQHGVMVLAGNIVWPRLACNHIRCAPSKPALDNQGLLLVPAYARQQHCSVTFGIVCLLLAEQVCLHLPPVRDLPLGNGFLHSADAMDKLPLGNRSCIQQMLGVNCRLAADSCIE